MSSPDLFKPNLHIASERLRELCKVPTPVEEPEWTHLRDCEECLNLFTELFKQYMEEQNSKLTDTRRQEPQ
jgi:hypothetical protein